MPKVEIAATKSSHFVVKRQLAFAKATVAAATTRASTQTSSDPATCLLAGERGA